MALVHVLTNLTFDERPQGVVDLPSQMPKRVLERAKQSLEEAGLQLRPGYIEKRRCHVWYVDGAESQESLRQHIAKAFDNARDVELNFYTSKNDEPQVYTDKFAETLHKRAPDIYNNAARLAGASYLTGAMGIMQSAMFDEKVESKRNQKDTTRWFKRFAAVNSMVSALITMFYGDEPTHQRDIHSVLKTIKRDYENREYPNPEVELAKKDTLLQEAHNYTRRLPWAVSGVLNFVSVTSRFVDQIFKSNRTLGNVMELVTSGIFMVSNYIRSFVPQHGGQVLFDLSKITDKLPWKPDTQELEGKIRRLPAGNEIVDDAKLVADQIRRAPLSISSDLSNLAEVGNLATGFVKGDGGLKLRSATVIAGNTIRRSANKKLGLGFDTVVTAAADFIKQWDYPGATLEQKVALLTRELSTQPEIFHTAGDMARGILARLGKILPQPDQSIEVEDGKHLATISRSHYLPKEQWIEHMPINLLEADQAVQTTMAATR